MGEQRGTGHRSAQYVVDVRRRISATATTAPSDLSVKMIRHDPTRRRYDPAYGPLSGVTLPESGSCSMLSNTCAIRCRSRAGVRARARSARLLRATVQVTKHVAQRAPAAACEFRFRLAQGF